MNKVLLTVIIMGITGGVYAAEFGDLVVKAGALKSTGIASDGVPVPTADKAAKGSCSFAQSLSSCESQSGCTWESNGLGGGTCEESSGPSYHCSFAQSLSSCESQSGCTWESNGLGSGTCIDLGRGMGNIGKQLQGVLSAKEFIDAFPMDRISPVLRYYRISDETFKTQIGSKLPSNLADVPVNYVIQVLGEASGLLATQDGGFYTTHRVRIRETLTDMSRKSDPNNAAAALVSSQHVWEWGCKRPVSYLGRGCEPENQLLMKEFIKIP